MNSKYKIYFFTLLLLLSAQCKTVKEVHIDKVDLLLNPQDVAFIDTITGSHEVIYAYHIKDSSIFYMGRGQNSYFNDENIEQNHQSMSIMIAQDDNKTFVSGGLDKNNKYWKHKVFGTYFLGYNNVIKKRQKKHFDNIIDNSILVR